LMASRSWDMTGSFPTRWSDGDPALLAFTRADQI
jgi:hypothetical protein